MGFRFRKSIKIIPGVKLNLNTKGVSLSVGGRGAHYTVGSSGERITVGIPGTGISYTEKITSTSKNKNKMSVCPNCGHRMRKAWVNCPKCKYILISSVEQNINPIILEKEKNMYVDKPAEKLVDKNHIYIDKKDYYAYGKEDILESLRNKKFVKRNSIDYQRLNIDNTETDNENHSEYSEHIDVVNKTNQLSQESSPSKKRRINPFLLGFLCLAVFFLPITMRNVDEPNDNNEKSSINVQKEISVNEKNDNSSREISTTTDLTAQISDKKESTTSPIVLPVESKVEEKVVRNIQPSEPKITPYEQNAIYVANARTGKIHSDGCRYTLRMKSYNKITFKGKRAAMDSGYVPCNSCTPF